MLSSGLDFYYYTKSLWADELQTFVPHQRLQNPGLKRYLKGILLFPKLIRDVKKKPTLSLDL